MTAAIELAGVTKSYGSFTAVDDLSLVVPTGEIVGFLGPNGAGKTTTIRMIMSILYPDRGRIAVLGRERALDVKDRIGYLPEERGLYRKMTVGAILQYIGQLKGLSGAKLTARVDECLKLVGLSDWRNKKVEALSKGMGQKIQFLTTILHEPELVILDEPFSGLDPINMEVLKDIVLDLKQRGCTVIFSTHQMEQAQRLCDRLILINRGRKLIDGTTPEIRKRFGRPVAVLEGQGSFEALRGAPGVTSAHTTAGTAELMLAEDADPNVLLQLALQHARVTHFELQQPSLHEIFVELVTRDQGAAAAEALASPAQTVSSVGGAA